VLDAYPQDRLLRLAGPGELLPHASGQPAITANGDTPVITRRRWVHAARRR
jgi:hypothetical protein